MAYGVVDFFLLLEQPCSLQICNHHLAGFLATHATVLLRAVVVQAAVGIQDVDDFQIMTLGHLPVVGVVGGGNLYHTSSKGPVNVGVRHHRDATTGEGQDDPFADELLVAGILRVDCHGSVSQKGFRAGGGNLDAAAAGEHGAVLQSDGRNGGSSLNLVVDVVHCTGSVVVLHLVVGQSGAAGGAPVHQIVSSIDEPPLVEGDKDLPHRLGKPLVQSKALPAPVHAVAQFSLLAGDDFVVLPLYLPGALKELLPPQIPAGKPLGLQAALHHVLGGDSGMVGSGNPQHIVPPHAVVANHNVLQGIVEAMAHVEDTGDVRRGNHHGKGLVPALLTAASTAVDRGVRVTFRLEIAPLLPLSVNSILKVLGIICLFQFNTLHIPAPVK